MQNMYRIGEREHKEDENELEETKKHNYITLIRYKNAEYQVF